MKSFLIATLIASTATLASADDVFPGVIFGSGNANGSFTTSTSGGIELGLRGKLRYNSSGSPENTFNYDGGNTYTFDPSNSSAPANRSIWNFEWSVNTDVDGTSGNNLSDFTYQLAIFQAGADGTDINDAFVFDMINTAYADHSIGDNLTTSLTDTVAGDPASYASLIASNNVAQNSWNLGFFNGPGTGPLDGVNPQGKGNYIIRLTAFDGSTQVASTDININVVPLPSAALAGLGLLGAFAGVRTIRRR